MRVVANETSPDYCDIENFICNAIDQLGRHDFSSDN